MSKRKPAWRDPRGPHVRLYEDIFDSAAWLTLSPRTRLLYIEMRTQLNGLNNGDVSCTLAFASKRNVTTSDTTLSEALFQLEALGFIRCMRRGLVRAGAPLPSLFRFTDEPFVQFTKVAGAGATGDGTIVYGPGAATFDYRKFKTRDDAEAQLAAAIADRFKKRADRVERGTAPGFRPLQKLERATPKNGSEVTRSTPKNGQEVAYPTPKTGDLMQLGVGVAARRKAGTGRKRALEVTVAGTTYKRLLCAADCCDHPARWLSRRSAT